MWGYAIRGEGHWLKIEEPPRALREVERNPEKLANADGRCWKHTLGRKRSFKTHRPLYPTRRGLVTAWQETKKLLHDESGRTMPGRTWRRKYPKTTRTGKATKEKQTKRKSGRVLWEPHRRYSRRKRRKTVYMYITVRFHLVLPNRHSLCLSCQADLHGYLEHVLYCTIASDLCFREILNYLLPTHFHYG